MYICVWDSHFEYVFTFTQVSLWLKVRNGVTPSQKKPSLDKATKNAISSAAGTTRLPCSHELLHNTVHICSNVYIVCMHYHYYITSCHRHVTGQSIKVPIIKLNTGMWQACGTHRQCTGLDMVSVAGHLQSCSNPVRQACHRHATCRILMVACL